MVCDYVVWFIEIVFGIGMFLNAMLFIPQAIKIYKTKNAKEISITTFIGFNVIQIFTILHGCVHNDAILIFGNILSFTLCAVVSGLAIKYR
jgi:MtN3 and saliva related transmembrane protein